MSKRTMSLSNADIRFDQGLIDRLSMALELAKAAGADDVSAMLGDHQSSSVSSRRAQIENLEREEQRDLTLDVYLGKRKSSVSLNDLSPPALKQAVNRAVDMAKVLPENPYVGLIDTPELSAIRNADELDIYDPQEPKVQWMSDFAAEMEAAALDTPGVTNSEGGVGWGLSSYLIANSRGFLGSFFRTVHSASVSPVAGSGERMQRDYDWSMAVYGSDLKPAAAIGQRAAQKAVAKLGAGRIETAVMPVVFDTTLAGGMVGTMMSALYGTNIVRGSSFLRVSMEKQILTKGISIIEDPFRPRGLRSAPFDGSGMATKQQKIIEDGVLKSWILDIASARQLDLQPTGNTGFSGGTVQRNVRLIGGVGTFEELIKDIPYGFYVTSLMGHGTNILTGDYSQGAAGFVIRDGAIAEPIENMTVAGNMMDMMKRATFAADDVYRSGMDAPSMRIDDMSVAGA